MTAKALPKQYQNTQILVYPFCGGYSDGLMMVNVMGKLDLRYHHNRSGCSGLWGWLNKDMSTAIEPQFIYALNFCDGRAIVCRGQWEAGEDGRYWCDAEKWGVIDPLGREVVPCAFDELYEIDNTDSLYFVHDGGWQNGHYGVFAVEEQKVILDLDFDFDIGYMFNERFVTDGDILVFDEHLPGEGKDLIYAYDLHEKRYIVYKEENTERTYNGEKKVVVNKDGKDIIVF